MFIVWEIGVDGFSVIMYSSTSSFPFVSNNSRNLFSISAYFFFIVSAPFDENVNETIGC